jgi:Tol biopolymer transport system component
MLAKRLLTMGTALTGFHVALVGVLVLVGTVLPAGEQMAFSFAPGWNSGPWAVYLLDVERQLAQKMVNSYSLGHPNLPVSWSPDGQRIAYMSYQRFNQQETIVYDLRTTRHESLRPEHADDYPAYNAVWSPDGTHIAFAGGDDIYVTSCAVGACSTSARNLTQHGEGYAYLAWSPDSRSLAYVNILGGSDIFVVDVQTGERRNLSHHSGRDNLPVWSPDGARIAFLSTRDGDWYDVYVMNRDGGGVRRLTHGNPLQSDLRLTWSPDGRYLLLGMTPMRGGSDIFLIDVEGARAINLTRDDARDSSPSWSPDGQRILFDSRRDGFWNVYVIERACAIAASPCPPLRLTDNTSDSRRPVWSPDGTRVAFMSSPMQLWRSWDIFVVNADGTGQPVRVTSGTGREVRFSPLWRP